MFFINYYNRIKELLYDNRLNKSLKNYSINYDELNTYHMVGKTLYEAGNRYGEGIIKEYSKKLTNDLGKGYSERNLRNMRQFYKICEIWQTMSAKLTWSHYCEIIYFDFPKFKYYVSLVEKFHLTVRELRSRIKSLDYERLPNKDKKSFDNYLNTSLLESVKNPIIINNLINELVYSEKVLHKLLLLNIGKFMKELGFGYSFIDSEYKIKLGKYFNYIDILLFNIEFNCYVVVELKVTELKKEHIGQVKLYMNYIDKNIKKTFHNNTIGIIVCKKNNRYVIEYSSDERIISREYQII